MNLAWAKEKIASMAKAFRRSKVRLSDTVTKGYLSAYKEFADGSRETIFENDPNVIMYEARRRHLAFLYDSGAVPDIITSFKVGSGGAIGSDTGGNTNTKVIAPNPSRNGLYTPISLVNKSIQIVPSTSLEDPNEVYLKISFTLSQDDANGLFINECGLFKDSGAIFNHKTFTSIPKNESFSLIFDWRIRYI